MLKCMELGPNSDLRSHVLCNILAVTSTEITRMTQNNFTIEYGPKGKNQTLRRVRDLLLS